MQFLYIIYCQYNVHSYFYSIAMVRYLAREYDIQDNWYPKDSKSQARVDEYLEWQHLNIRLFGSMVFRERVCILVFMLHFSSYNVLY